MNLHQSLVVLKQRVDIIPPALALAQAAIESNWGTSRFATQGNNYFGQWCYIKGCGLIPKNRKKGAIHEVKKFKNAYESVASYMNNINTNKAYARFRLTRATQRSNDRTLSAIILADDLKLYSARGYAYINELKKLMDQNKTIWPDMTIVTSD